MAGHWASLVNHIFTDDQCLLHGAAYALFNPLLLKIYTHKSFIGGGWSWFSCTVVCACFRHQTHKRVYVVSMVISVAFEIMHHSKLAISISLPLATALALRCISRCGLQSGDTASLLQLKTRPIGRTGNDLNVRMLLTMLFQFTLPNAEDIPGPSTYTSCLNNMNKATIRPKPPSCLVSVDSAPNPIPFAKLCRRQACFRSAIFTEKSLHAAPSYHRRHHLSPDTCHDN